MVEVELISLTTLDDLRLSLIGLVFGFLPLLPLVLLLEHSAAELKIRFR